MHHALILSQYEQHSRAPCTLVDHFHVLVRRGVDDWNYMTLLASQNKRNILSHMHCNRVSVTQLRPPKLR